MKQRVVGTYYIGLEQAQLVLREGLGGEFWLCPEDGSLPRIKIGGDYIMWSEVVGILVHEAFEFAMLREGARFSPAPDYARSTDAYLFVMDHVKFSAVSARVGQFLALALPDFSEAWNKWDKARRKRAQK